MKKLFITFFAMLLPLLAIADAVNIGNIYYNLVPKVKQAEVTSNPYKYSGDIIIPGSFTHEGVEYTVSKIGNDAFDLCTNLTSVTIPNSVKSIGNSAFNFCTSLTSITIPNSVTSIGGSAFSGCKSLPSITIPNGVTTIGSHAFSVCSELKSIAIPNSVTSLGIGVFKGCGKLESVTLSNIIITIPAYTFQDCNSLTSIIIPTNVTSIEQTAFCSCSSLISVDIPDGVTSIDNSAFYNCTDLTSITIPQSVTSIGSSAFSNCPNLANVYCYAVDVPQTKTNAFDGSYIESAKLHVPESSLSKYENTAPWSGFGQFVASGEAPELPKCATPTISIVDEKVTFTCETEGVDFISTVSTPDAKKYYDGELTFTRKYTVSVYATKAGFKDSDTATADFTPTGKFGDLNGDGLVNVADHVRLSSIIMDEEKE